MVRTKIVNRTTHVVSINEGTAGIYRDLRNIPPMKAFLVDVDPAATYSEKPLKIQNLLRIMTTDDLIDNEEITLYEMPSQKIDWRPSKIRGESPAYYYLGKGDISDSAAFDAVKKDASSRMKSIGKSHARFVMLSKQVKVCPAQCWNLVQTCLEGGKEMKDAYNEKSEDDMWQLYNSKKLGQLISSLDKLLSTLGSIQDLLQACGSNWGSMALDVSLPLPSLERMSSKFDILIKEIHWNFEMIYFALHLDGSFEFKWNEWKVRYALETIAGAKMMVAKDMELEQPPRLASTDRKHLLSQLERGSMLVPQNPCLFGFLFGCKFATDHRRDELAAQLLKRLKGTSDLSNDHSSVLDCFCINIADLKLRNKLYEDFNSKTVWRGGWCGQTVA